MDVHTIGCLSTFRLASQMDLILAQRTYGTKKANRAALSVSRRDRIGSIRSGVSDLPVARSRVRLLTDVDNSDCVSCSFKERYVSRFAPAFFHLLPERIPRH